ncbi:MAG: outer membrane lipoprotein carrier protein LolA [Bacteroidota bacterium]
MPSPNHEKTHFHPRFAFFTVAVWAQYDPKALETLDAMSKKYKAMEAFEANIVCNMTNEIDKVNEEFKGKITVKGNKFRLALPEQEIFNDGATQWTYLPAAKEVNIDNYDPSSGRRKSPQRSSTCIRRVISICHWATKRKAACCVKRSIWFPIKKMLSTSRSR